MSETALDAAARRLDLALAKLESRVGGMLITAKSLMARIPRRPRPSIAKP